MNILVINGNSKNTSTTKAIIDELKSVFERDGISIVSENIGVNNIRGCISCDHCRNVGKCVFGDAVNEIAPKLEEADGIVVISSTYYTSSNPTVLAFIDRILFSTNFEKKMKVGASIAVSKYGSCSPSVEEVNKYFTSYGMPVISSTFGRTIHDSTELDETSLQSVRSLAENMSFLLRCIELGKLSYGFDVSPYERTQR